MTRDEARTRITETLTELTTDIRWAQLLRVMGTFHRYSLNNTLLIFSQRPEATLVHGYRAWQALGRQVQSGERGITILAPLVKREADHDKEQDGAPKVMGFRTVSVFDVGQTQGDPIRGLPERLAGDQHAALLAAIEAAIPFPVRRAADLRGANGVFYTQERTIAVLEHLAPDMQVKTLLHEWAHGLRSAEDTRPRGGRRGGGRVDGVRGGIAFWFGYPRLFGRLCGLVESGGWPHGRGDGRGNLAA